MDLAPIFTFVVGILLENIKLTAFLNVELSPEQRRGINTVFPKVGKDPSSLKNLRPISLLNSDYKIEAKVLSGRLKFVLPSIIGRNKLGFWEEDLF